MDKQHWCRVFSDRLQELDSLLSGTDTDDIASDVYEHDKWAAMDPKSAAEL